MDNKVKQKMYQLKDGNVVLIRQPLEADAEAVIALMKKADAESRFLAREPGEIAVTVENEQKMILERMDSKDSIWYVAVYEGVIVGQCSIGLLNSYKRYRHRAGVALLVLKEYWGLGIGGKMMLECIDWCKEHNVEQLELEVVEENINAISMYESFGFKIVGKIENALKYADGTYADEYHMIMKIE